MHNLRHMGPIGRTPDPADGTAEKDRQTGGLPGRPGFELAGVARLWAAAILDAALGFALWLLCARCILAVKDLPRDPFALPREVLPGLLALAVFLHLGYHVLCIGWSGQTPGKRAMGIAVVRSDGSPAGYGKALLRSLGGMISVLTLGLANLGVLVRRDRRGAGDWLAGTRLIRIPPS